MSRPGLHVDTKVHVLEEGRHVRVVEAGIVQAKNGWLELQGIRGMVNNSVLFCWLFTIEAPCKKMRLQQTHNQGFMSGALDAVPGPLRLAHHT